MMQAVWIMTGEAAREEGGGVGTEYSVGRMGNVVDSIQLVLQDRFGRSMDIIVHSYGISTRDHSVHILNDI
jgi:hypothetical protein